MTCGLVLAGKLLKKTSWKLQCIKNIRYLHGNDLLVWKDWSWKVCCFSRRPIVRKTTLKFPVSWLNLKSFSLQRNWSEIYAKSLAIKNLHYGHMEQLIWDGTGDCKNRLILYLQECWSCWCCRLSPPRSEGPKYVSVLVEISIEHPPRPAAGNILKL